MGQSKEQIISQLIDEASDMEIAVAVSTINEHFVNHTSSTEPYLLHNANIALNETQPCKCTIHVDEYYMKLHSDKKRTIIYSVNLGEMILNHDWVQKGEIFQLKTEKGNHADVQVFNDGKLEKELTTDIVEFASPKNREDELIMSFARLQKACHTNEIYIPNNNNTAKSLEKDEMTLGRNSQETAIISLSPEITNSNTEVDSEYPTYDIRFKVFNKERIPLSSIHIDLNQDPLSREGSKLEYNINKTDDGYIHDYRNVINLSYGTNIVSIAMETTDGITGLDPYKINYLPIKPNLFVYSIGIPSSDLKYTSQDAQDLGNIFSLQNDNDGLFGKVEINIITDAQETTKQGLARHFENIKNDYTLKNRIGSNDVVIFYLSSHGFYHEESQKYKIAASNYDPLYSNSSSLDFENDILDVIASVNCKKVFFLDACYSGSINYPKYDGTKSGRSNEIELAKSLSVLLNGKNDSYFIVSSSQDEKSYEDDKWENGAFTEAIIRGLKPKEHSFASADDNADNIVYLFELVDYLQEAVPRIVSAKIPKTSTSQNPILIDGLSKLDIPIFSYK